ncbi:MAG TPA: hypothetical protein QGF05_09015 [Dehalococcoidia bacterium]|nr:hypothetical protein [Dehalococcoidia bacterium]
MAHIIVESDATNSAAGSDDGASGPFVFSVETIDLLALLSFGYAEPFGSQHQLTRFVRRLRQHHDIDVTPLMTFYDRDVTDAEDLANLEAAWQSAAPLAGTLRATLSALQDDQETAALLDGFGQLAVLLPELASMADWAAARDAQIRLSFSMQPTSAAPAAGPTPKQSSPGSSTTRLNRSGQQAVAGDAMTEPAE